MSVLSRPRRLRPRVPEPVAVLAVAAVVEVGLRVTTLPRLSRFLGVRLDLTSPAGRVGLSPRLPHWAERSEHTAARLMAHWPFGDTCLRRCLVQGHRLRGLDPVLRIGVRPGESGVLAHSWIEIDGESLDPSANEFTVMSGAQ